MSRIYAPQLKLYTCKVKKRATPQFRCSKGGESMNLKELEECCFRKGLA